MPTFIRDNTALPATKSDKNAVPGGQDPNKYDRAVDFNNHTTALADTRSWLQGDADYVAGKKQASTPGLSSLGAFKIAMDTDGVLKASIDGAIFKEIVSRISNARDFGAKGDGVTDDTAALQAFFNAGGGFLPNPAVGQFYKTTDTLVIPQLSGFILVGQSKITTVIKGTAALAGKPVVKLNGCRDSWLTSFRVNGSDTGSNQPSAGIEIRADTVGYSTHNKISDVTIGSDFGNTMVSGIKTDFTRTPLTGTVTVTNGSANVLGVGTSFLSQLAVGALVRFAGRWQTYIVASITDDTHCTVGPISYPFGSVYNEATAAGAAAERVYDLGNDLHTIDNVDFRNISGAAVDINGLNSLAHTIRGGQCTSAIGIQTAGGSYTADGFWLNCSDTNFKALDGTYEHPLIVNKCQSESSAKMLTTTTVPNLHMQLSGMEQGGAAGGSTFIDFQATGASSCRFNHCRIFTGQAGTLAQFTASDSFASFVDCEMGFSDIAWNGTLVRLANHWPLGPGAVTETAGGGAKLFTLGESGASFDGGLRTTTSTLTGAISASNLSGSSSGANTGDVTFGAVGSTPSANGASVSGQTVTLQPADDTHPGLVTALFQTFAGPKVFSNDVQVNGNLNAVGGLIYRSTAGRLALQGGSTDVLNAQGVVLNGGGATFTRADNWVTDFQNNGNRQGGFNGDGTFRALGALGLGVADKSASATADGAAAVIRMDASGGARTVTLPLAANAPGRVYVIKKVDSSANAVTVSTSGSDLIDGAATYSLPTQYKFVTVVNNGSAAWSIIGAN